MTEGKEYVSGGGYVKHLDQFVEGGNVSNKRYPTSIIEFATGKSKSVHPTQKPIKLYEWLLHNYAKEGDKILDTHLGSGSIAIACHNLGYDLTACELDTEYYEAAMKRIEQHKQQIRMF